jgi:hypothetical protein
VPQRHEHLARAEENEKLAEVLNKNVGVCLDWGITIIFYAALHYIQAYLAGKNFRPLTHKQRDDEIENNGSLAPIFSDYRRLKDLSRDARYDVPNFNIQKFNLAKEKLAKIKAQILGLL